MHAADRRAADATLRHAATDSPGQRQLRLSLSSHSGGEQSWEGAAALARQSLSLQGGPRTKKRSTLA